MSVQRKMVSQTNIPLEQLRIFGSRITNLRDSLILRLGLSSFFPARQVAGT